MFFKTINKIKNSYHHNLDFIKLDLNKKEFILINIFIKLGVLKKVVFKEGKYFIYFHYINNKKVFFIKNIHTPSNKKYLKLTTLKKLTIKKNWILILSTNKGVMTSVEATKKNVGGLIIAKIWN